MGLRISVLDGSQRLLASGSTVTLNLSGGRVYYINVADSAGASGLYDLSLVKASNVSGGGAKKGMLKAPQLADDNTTASLVDEMDQLTLPRATPHHS